MIDPGTQLSSHSGTVCSYCRRPEGHSPRCSVTRHGAPELRTSEGGDSMGVTEHWIARGPVKRVVVIEGEDAEARAEKYRTVEWTVEGPFVPASHLTGAVAAIRAALIELDNPSIKADPAANDALRERAVAILRSAFGGQ